MAEIIVQGVKIDTKDIWDVVLDNNTRHCKITIRIADKPDIVIKRSIPYETRSGEFQEYWRPYKKLYEEVKAKWEADKADIPVFKL